MPDKKIIAVVGATGAQVGGLVRAILEDSSGAFAVRALTRDAGTEKARELSQLGVEVVDRATAAAIKEGLRERGVLIGSAGRDGNVLKIRPPLAFSAADTEVFVDALAATLGSVGSR